VDRVPPHGGGSTEVERKHSAPPCPIVALGASAGGLEALREFLQCLPRDVGASFVILQHLAPHQPSRLPELLSGYTHMRVEEARDDVVLEANRVYVVPPAKAAVVRGGRLGLRDGVEPRGAVIDELFRSLAEDQRELAVAAVFSGSGADGAAGAVEVERCGGLAMVQHPDAARFDGMPRAAIDAGLRGPALPIPELAQTLVRHVAAIAARCQGPVALTRAGVPEIPPEVWKAIRDSTGRDLSGYKPGTVARRIARRMQLLGIEALSAYLARLESDPEEPRELLDELLIGVTSFFRDAEVFSALETQIVPRLAARTADDGELRVWVPGCATGEEAYSIAMLVAEELGRAGRPLRAQIFATDLDAAALEHARAGVYSRQAVEHVRRDRLERFFSPRDDGWAVSKELREICLFSEHHLTADPPFSRLDFISCRNVLIYLENELKRQVLPLFHYALKPGGLLLLGPSESVGEHDDLFAPVDSRLRIFERRYTDARLPLRFRVAVRSSARTPRPTPAPLRESTMRTSFEQVLLRELSPAAAVVDAAGQVIHFSGPIGRFLTPPQGPPSNSVVELAREELRLEIRTALHRAVRDHAPVVQRNIALEVDGAPAVLDLHVRPLEGPHDQFLVVFRELAAAPPATAATAGSEEPAVVQQLRAELRATREHLQATIEELEASNARFKLSNDELVTVNEELQSANEELQTSQEELQSLNEEHQTVNAELSAKIEELDRTNSDLQNLLQSTEIAALFLGKDLVIKKFTPAATQLFRLIDGDLGRPLTDLAARFSDSRLVPDVAEVLATLRARERQVHMEQSDTWWVRRVLPYVTTERVLDGVVITFSDITELKRAEAALRESERRTREILDSVPLLVWTGQPDGRREDFSPQWVAYTGESADDQIGFGWLQHVHPEDRERVREAWRDAVAREVPYQAQLRLRRSDGAYRWFQSRAVPLRDPTGRVRRWFGFSADVDDLKRAEAAVRESEQRFRAAIDGFPGVLVLYDADRRIQYANRVALEIDLGRKHRELIGHRDEDLVPPEIAQRFVPILELAIATGEPQSFELQLPESVGGITALVRYVPIIDDGKVHQVLGIAMDITKRKRMETQLREADRRKDEFLTILGHELRNPLAPLRNSVQILRRSSADDVAVQRAATIMGRQVEQLTRLVDDLVDVSRISRGKIALRRAPVDVAEVVRNAVDDHQPLAAAAGLRVVGEVPPGPVWVDGDAARLSQIIGNLLQNGLKFTDRGGEVHVRVAVRDGRVRVAVRDTGIGIDPALIDEMFQPFRQAHGAATGRGGLGLGLTLVKGLVEMHGGRVFATSAGHGYGAEFEFELPLGAAPAPARPDAATRSRRVLLVDDNSDAVETLADLLRLDGHAVEVAPDGPSALDAARRFRPDVTVCDIGLPPPLDGYGVARAFRDDPGLKGTYLVALTGYAGPEDQRRAREAGFDLHLAKPPSLERLREALNGG
jgi:two-component system CheB/CheR fusion protein